MQPVPILMSWSGGKDCVLALDVLRRDPQFEVVELASSFCRETGRIAVHEVRRELIRKQAVSLGLPLAEVELPSQPSNTEYESIWQSYFHQRGASGVRHAAFGDLFLQDVRAYRERFLGSVGMQAIFPLWGESTPALARRAIASGLLAVVCSCDPQRLDRRFAGRLFDSQLIEDLPAGCDPCGENGEFHTFVYDGPGFSHPVPWRRGGIARRGSVDFCDLLPLQPDESPFNA
jgi:uncharacterized protein (TIGR00290 family)